MNTADEAFKQARDKIIEARDSGARELWLDDEPFRALTRLPDEIADCVKLRDLDLRRTQVSDLSPLSGLTSLQRLNLNGTQVGDLSPLSGLTSLQELTLTGTQVNDLLPLSGLTSLQRLSLSDTQVGDLSPLSGLTSLQGLDLIDTQVRDLSLLSGLTSLLGLALEGTQVSDLSPLSGLTSLLRLGLDGTQVSDLSPLSGLTSLQWLNLNGTQVGDLRPVAGLEALTSDELLTGFLFDAIPALDHDPQLRALSELGDGQDRTRQTLDYLRTLPPYPQPLPWQVPDQDQDQDQEKPDELSAQPESGVSLPAAPATPTAARLVAEIPRTVAMAAGAAFQIRALLVSAPIHGNEYSPLLQNAYEIAVSLDQIAEVQDITGVPARVAAMQQRIAELERKLDSLTAALNDSEQRRQAAEDLTVALQAEIARGNSLWHSLKHGAAAGGGVALVSSLVLGIGLSAHALLGDDNPVIREYHEAMGHSCVAPPVDSAEVPDESGPAPAQPETDSPRHDWPTTDT